MDEVQEQLNDRFVDAEDDKKPPPFRLEVVECHFGGEGGTVSDDDPIEYQTSTGLMWGAVREALRLQTIKLYPDEKQIAQLSNRKYSVNSAGKIELERKEAMKKRGLSSPDMGDALALALLAWMGEFELVPEHGTEWERVAGQHPSRAIDEADDVLRRSIFQEPYVQEIEDLDLQVEDRTLHISFWTRTDI